MLVLWGSHKEGLLGGGSGVREEVQAHSWNTLLPRYPQPERDPSLLTPSLPGPLPLSGNGAKTLTQLCGEHLGQVGCSSHLIRGWFCGPFPWRLFVSIQRSNRPSRAQHRAGHRESAQYVSRDYIVSVDNDSYHHHFLVIYYEPFLCMGFAGSSAGKKSACNAGDPGLIPGSGRSPREGNGYPLQYSDLENSMDRGAWQATVPGLAKSRTWLTDFHFTFLCVHHLIYSS